LKNRANMTAVGAFVVAAIGLAVGAVVLLSSGAIFRDTFAVVSLFDGSVQGLQIGAPVSFRGVQIGTVKEIRLQLPNDPRLADPNNVDARIPIVYEIDRTLLAARGGTAEFSEERLRQLVEEQGLRAQLSTESFVTGRLLISLDFRPDLEARLDDWDLGYVQIPTISTPIEEIQQQLAAVFDRLAEVDIEKLMSSADRLMNSFADVAEDSHVEELTASLEYTLSQLDQTMASFRDVAQDVSGNIDQVSDRAADRAEQLESVLAEAEMTMTALRNTLDPQSPIAVQMAITLREFGDAARALRVLTEALEQNPSALLRGRAVPGGNP
jgi:paraquat-inducible protein B